MIDAISATLHNVYPDRPAAGRAAAHPVRPVAQLRHADSLPLTIYVHDDPRDDKHAATVALTDSGPYVLALAPPDIKFPAEDTEDVNVANLPTVYRAIWETARKHDMPDDITRRIVGMYRLRHRRDQEDLARRFDRNAGVPPDGQGKQELLYVGLILGST